ncbi:hypothetical protein PIROE2DRAFT_12104 [Piromyces sp. E2]|nr:hypothetical protein PIROE2DRAFT_12104 [Piromyces sp. E2]|eukprot:OUM61801.1 hypothetical protein PIROE2DRAFT_12104 [Piromyces sp. E2]
MSDLFNENILLQHRFMSMQVKIQGEGAKKVQELIIENEEGNKTYPTLAEMKECLLKTYKLKKNPEERNQRNET